MGAEFVPQRLRDLFDFVFGTPTDGDVIAYDAATDMFVLSAVAAGGATSLLDLTDIAGTDGAGKAPVSDGADTFTLTDIATQAELDAHAADTTSVHGITDTSVLETTTGSQAKADAAETAAETYADSAVATHSADTTSVHGIADTSALETTSGAQAKADAAAAAAEAASQPLDADLTAIAALSSATSGAIASDGAGWIKKTYAQFKTALSLVASDVGLGNVTNDAQLKASQLDTDGTLAADSDAKVASQKAVKTYVDANAGGGLTKLFDSTLSADATSIDTGAGGIPAGHGVLEIWVIARTTQAVELSTVQITVNGDTGTHYDGQAVIGSGSTASAGAAVTQTNWATEVPGASDEAGAAGMLRISIPGYDQTTFHKQGEFTTGAADPTTSNNRVRVESIRWKSTAAITRLAVTAGSGNLVAGSRLLIYGTP